MAVNAELTRLYRHAPEFVYDKLDHFISDVDSTAVNIETGDEALILKGVVATKTAGAMNGTVPFEVAFREKYNAGRLSQTEVEGISLRLSDQLVPGVRDTVHGLQSIGIKVDFISGGIQQALQPLEEILLLPPASIHAIPFLFHDGEYAGYDKDCVLLLDDGKARVIEQIVGQRKSAMTGDGKTDWNGAIRAQTVTPVFPIAFAGVVGEDAREWMNHAPVVIRRGTYTPHFALAAGVNEWQRIHDDGTHASLLHDSLGHVVSNGVVLRDGYEVLAREANEFVRRNDINVEGYFTNNPVEVYNRAARRVS